MHLCVCFCLLEKKRFGLIYISAGEIEKHLWIGARYDGTKWVWDNGDPFSVIWYPGEPNAALTTGKLLSFYDM
mgnify:CR=1 FL=1